MSIRNLQPALHQASIAVVGAIDLPGTIGAVVLRNITEAGFTGPVWPIAGHSDVESLPGVPDLAVVLSPAEEVPAVIAALGARGCRLVVVGSTGLTHANGLRQKMLDAAHPYLLRVIGPGSLGLIVPSAHLNASAAHMRPLPGQIALLSQSGAIANALIDWATQRGIGFSQVVALGGMADVDVGDYLDLLAMDGRTRAIMLYLESIPEPRKFLSAARAVSRMKPVIAIKAGRSEEAAIAAATHTGVLSGADAVVEAALRRAGILRVRGLAEMFSAAETVARFRPLSRARLGVITNAGGAGVLAVDRLSEGVGDLAQLAPSTFAALDLPGKWTRSNPLDIGDGASAEHYLSALNEVAGDNDVDVVLVMNCPSAVVNSTDVARAVAKSVQKGMVAGKPVLACWLGGATATSARGILRAAGVASYDNPGAAAAAVGHLTNWGRVQAELMRVPDRLAEEALGATPPDAKARVTEIFAAVAAAGRSVLSEPQAKAALAAYGIPVPALRVAATPEEAREIAAEMLPEAGELVVKILSPDIGHKSDIGGVVLGIATAEEAEAAARGILRRFRKALPEARLDGLTLQPMVQRPEAQELILGVAHDPVFGPVILFGMGGIAVEVLRDIAIALPPLDTRLAADLVARTRVGQLLAGYRGRPPADSVAIGRALIALSHMIEDFPCLMAVDVNPLLADADGVMALDARIEINPEEVGRKGPNPHLAIRPYPGGWRRTVGAFVLRPILPADAALYPEFFRHVAPEDIRMRFLGPRGQFTEADALRWSQLDYDREVAFIGLTPEGELAGVSRISCDPDHRLAEYSLLVRSDLKGRGLGRALMALLIDYARADGIRRLEGMVLSDNPGMRHLIASLGFRTAYMPDEPGVVMTHLEL